MKASAELIALIDYDGLSSFQSAGTKKHFFSDRTENEKRSKFVILLLGSRGLVEPALPLSGGGVRGEHGYEQSIKPTVEQPWPIRLRFAVELNFLFSDLQRRQERSASFLVVFSLLSHFLESSDSSATP